MTDQILRLLRKAEVCNRTGLSERAISDRLAAGSFPKPVFIDARNPAWIESEVLAWIQQRIADRDHDIVPPGRAALIEARRLGGRKAQANRRMKIATD